MNIGDEVCKMMEEIDLDAHRGGAFDKLEREIISFFKRWALEMVEDNVRNGSEDFIEGQEYAKREIRERIEESTK